MAHFHFNVKHVSRGKGDRAIAAAAYISGQKLKDTYNGITDDYTKKGGVIFTEILLPPYAPERFLDRETLWNEVEFTEQNKRAQLAYSFNIALQNEFTIEENIELAKRFVLENFVSRGMICDLAIHNPTKNMDENSNPHFHVLAPIRPLNPDGTWGNKQRRVYELDEAGNRIRDSNGKYIFKAVSTTDWNLPDTLIQWRANWAKLVNEKFTDKGLPEKIDHRSFAERGIGLLPTIHEGARVRAMEKRGVRTDVGDINREIKQCNNLLMKLLETLKELFEWSKNRRLEKKKLKAELKQQEQQNKESQAEIERALFRIFDKKIQTAYSNNRKIKEIKNVMENISFLSSENIYTFEDFSNAVAALYKDAQDAIHEFTQMQANRKDLVNELRYMDYYESGKRIYDKLCQIKSKDKSDAFKAKYKDELDKFYLSRRKLSAKYPDFKYSKKELQKAITQMDHELPMIKQTYEFKLEKAKHFYSVKKALESELNITPKSKQRTRQESL